jgi:3-oxoacyl-(acyl-carrier-protein) synthase
MSVHVAGTGWVTPLGSNLDDVWSRLLAGDQAPVEEVTDPLGDHRYPAFRVPQSALKNLPAHPRLRRASAISRFAAAAGLSALADANLSTDKLTLARSALVFAVANGGVIYTKRFYNDIVKTGAEAASPLLFPETVFNAAASHVAAIMGLSGTTYTVVGDGAVGLTGIKMAEDLMSNSNLDYCLVVAAEEADWLLCDAYQKWRLLRSKPPIELFERSARGTILGEGAGAVLLARNGPIQIQAVSAGGHFRDRRRAGDALARVLNQVGAKPDSVVIGSANGTFVDRAEANALDTVAPSGLLYSPKPSLGEGVGAGALWQVVIGIKALVSAELPQPQYPKSGAPPSFGGRAEVTILSCGLNQQVGAVRLGIT